MATQGPAPVDTGAAALVVARPIDRAPAPVPPGPGTTGQIPTARTPVGPPEAVPPAVTPSAGITVPPVATPQGPPETVPPAVTPGPGTGQSASATVTPTVPVQELPVDTPNVDAGTTIIPTINYIQVLANGTVVVAKTTAMNFAGTGVTVTGSNGAATITISGGNGSSYGDSNVVTLLSSFGSNTVSTTGNVTGGYILGNGSQLTGIAASYGNANVVANLAALGSNPVSTTGNVTASYVFGNGSQLTGLPATYGNANVVANLAALGSNPVSTTGNVTSGNVITSAQVIATGVIQSGTGLSTGGYLSVNGTTDLHDTTVTGNLSATGNVTIPGNIVGTSTIVIDNRATGNGADINLFAADDITLQARDRSAGSTSEGGDIDIFAGDSAEDSDSSGGDVEIRGGDGGAANVDFGGSGGYVTIQSGQGGAASTGVDNYGARPGGALTLRAGDGGTNNGNIDRGAAGGNVIIEAGDSTGNGINGGTIYLTSGAADASGLAGNVVIQAGGTWTFGSTGNLTAPGNISAVGNITGNYILGNGSQLTGLPATYGNANVVANLAALGSNPVSTTGNVTSGNVLTGGLISATGNVTGGNILGGANVNATTHTGTTVSVSANVTGGNLRTAGLISATGNITGGNLSAVNLVINNITSDDSTLVSVQDGLQVYGNIIADNLGNVAAINLDGNVSNVLSGTGTWITAGGGAANTGNVTFSDVNIIGTGNLNLQPNDQSSEYLNIYLTGAADIHVAAGGGSGNVILGTDEQANVAVLLDGNVAIQAGNVGGTKTWNFDTAGNLTLPLGGIVYETNIPDGALSGSAIALKPPGGTTANQQLLIYPTANDGDHIHLTSGNLYTTELFLGSDNLYVKLANTGNVVINSNNGNSSNAMWTFGTDGTTTFPAGNITSGTSLQFTTTFANVKTVEYQTAGVWDLYVEDSITGSNTASSRLNVSFKDNLIDKPQVYIENTKESDGVALRWTFDENGNLKFPRDVAGNTDPYLTIVGGASPRILSEDASLAGPANLEITALNTIFTGASGSAIKIYADDGEIASDGNLQIWANAVGNTQYSWTFDTTGNLTTPSNLVIGPGPGSGSSIFQYDAALQILGEGANSVVLMGWAANTSAPDSVATIAMNYPGGGEGNILIAVGNNATTVNYWLFDNTGNLRLPGNTFAVNYANGTAVSLGGSSYGNANVVANLAALGSNPISTTGNITGGNILGGANVNATTHTGTTVSVSANVTGGNLLTGGLISATSTITSAANITGGNILTGGLISATANVTGGNILTAGQVSATGNIVTANSFVGNLVATTVSATGNVTANSFVGNGATLSNVATTFESTWTVPTGNSTQNFTVAASNTYLMWVDCNIPNGILTWNATASITNTNVPVVGAQYAWVYTGGGTPIDFTSIPDQFVGTANTIIRSNTSPSATTNRFDFGINNTSGGNVTVRYGWAQIS